MYIHTYIHACIHTFNHTCIHTFNHTCIHNLPIVPSVSKSKNADEDEDDDDEPPLEQGWTFDQLWTALQLLQQSGERDTDGEWRVSYSKMLRDGFEGDEGALKVSGFLD